MEGSIQLGEVFGALRRQELVAILEFALCGGPRVNDGRVVGGWALKFAYPFRRQYRMDWLIKRYRRGWDLPPLVINYSGGGFELNDGNHRHEMLRRLGIRKHRAIFRTSEASDCQRVTAALSKLTAKS